MYQLKNDSFGNLRFVFRLSDSCWIPIADESSEYQEYLAWLAEGNTPLPADTPEAEDPA